MVFLWYFLGLLPLMSLPADAFMVPLFTTERLNMVWSMLMQRNRWILARIVYSVLALIQYCSNNLYRHLKSRGVVVVVWVLNEVQEFNEALAYYPNIDGVMTDCPTKLR